MPRWTVTWPTFPYGVYTQVVEAADATDAVRVASRIDWPTNDGYRVAFGHTPEVWRLRRPYRLRAYHAAGPHLPEDYGD